MKSGVVSPRLRCSLYTHRHVYAEFTPFFMLPAGFYPPKSTVFLFCWNRLYLVSTEVILSLVLLLYLDGTLCTTAGGEAWQKVWQCQSGAIHNLDAGGKCVWCSRSFVRLLRQVDSSAHRSAIIARTLCLVITPPTSYFSFMLPLFNYFQ